MMTKNISEKTAFYKVSAIVTVLMFAPLLFGQGKGLGNTKSLDRIINDSELKLHKITNANWMNRLGSNIFVDSTPTKKPRTHTISKGSINTKNQIHFKSRFDFSPAKIDTPKNTFSIQPSTYDEKPIKNYFSTADSKVHKVNSDIIDFADKLILIRGKEVTKSELTTLSLAKIKFIKPFKGNDDLGNGTFEKLYGEKAKNGGFWIVLKDTDN